MPRNKARRREPLPPRRTQQSVRRREPRPRPSLPPEVTQVFTIPGYAILPLRAFLGITFVYAGYQKLTDSGFFRLGSTSYIGTQILNFSRHSPISFLMSHFLEHAVLIGVLTIMAEITIGLLILLGLFTRLAALAGLVTNLVFFLSASWNVYPYFLGSDIVFVMAWLTLAITGPGAYALDPLLVPTVRDVFSRGLQRLVQGPMIPLRASEPAAATPEPVPLQAAASQPEVSQPALRLSRREALVGGFAALFVVILGLGPRTKLGAASVASKAALPTPNNTPQPGAQATPTPQAGASAPTPASGSAAGTKVGNTSQLPVNSALNSTDPTSGDPAVVVNTAGAGVVAYDAVCTHAGCTVQYDPQYKLLVCPCHGGAFDPAHNAQVVAGPPPAPLTRLPVKVDAQGNITLT